MMKNIVLLVVALFTGLSFATTSEACAVPAPDFVPYPDEYVTYIFEVSEVVGNEEVYGELYADETGEGIYLLKSEVPALAGVTPGDLVIVTFSADNTDDGIVNIEVFERVTDAKEVK